MARPRKPPNDKVEKRDLEGKRLDNAEVKKAIKSHCAFLKAKAAQRKVINQEISASRNALVARGLNRKALTVAEAYHKMEDQHRDGFDSTLVIAREAIGYPMQGKLFEAEPEAENPAARPAAKKKTAAKKEAAAHVPGPNPLGVAH